MSYRDEILDYVGECLGGILGTLRSPRVDELSPENVETIHERLQDLVHLAEEVLEEQAKTLD